jgi:ABC-type sugar transport system ATPase subunit
LMFSSELTEILGMSDRVIVMYKGKIMHEMNTKEADQETIMHYMSGGDND